MPRIIRRAAVIGAGTMGAAIAAHLANAGIPTYLLDIVPRELTPKEEAKGLTLESPEVRNRIVREGFMRAKKAKPANFFNEDAANVLTAYFENSDIEGKFQEPDDGIATGSSMLLAAKAIKEIIDDASAIADALILKAEPPNKLIIKAEGEMREMTVELMEGEDAVVSIDIQEEARAVYSIDYLKKFAKGADVSDIAILKFKTDYPLWLEYRYLDKMILTFILAPRTE